MALSTVAGWAGSAIIRKLVNLAFTYLGERMLPADTKPELERLNLLLPKITAVMSVAEALKLKYPNAGVHAWLEQFKLAFQAAEDVLDELEYQKLKEVVNNQNQVGGLFTPIAGWLKKKVSCCSNINGDMLERLRGAVRKLDQASKDVGDLYQLATGLDLWAANISSRETSSFLTESEVVGREYEKAIIIEWLKKEAPHTLISAFSIVGPGGLGKTTLAQLISDEMSRENHFDNRVWVCVSTDFNVKDTTRKLLEQLGEKKDGGESLDNLQKMLKEKIQSRKILLILDDVWKEDGMCEWETLLSPLNLYNKGVKYY